MITALLASAVLGLLLYKQISTVALCVCCVAAGVTVAILTRHKHTQFLAIDVIVQTSRLKYVNAMLKFWAVLVLLVICVASKTPVAGLFLTGSMFILVVFISRVSPYEYMRLMALPVSFLLLCGLALLVEVTSQSSGVVSVNAFGFWLSVSEETQARAGLVMARALGAVSCLYMLSLTTPMSQIIGVLRRIHCPGIFIDLMYLIYRYIFILLDIYHTMKDAAKSRLGFINYKTSIRTTASIYAGLMGRSYRLAGKNFDAMESRCYDTQIRFLETKQRITAVQGIAAVSIIAVSLAIFVRFG